MLHFSIESSYNLSTKQGLPFLSLAMGITGKEPRLTTTPVSQSFKSLDAIQVLLQVPPSYVGGFFLSKCPGVAGGVAGCR